MTLLDESESRRVEAVGALDCRRRVELGQVFTPAPVARFLASMFDLRLDRNRLLDPGAGVGQLTAAFADRWVAAGGGPLDVTAVERDEGLQPALSATLNSLPGDARLIGSDYLEWANGGLFSAKAGLYDYVIMNPPYAKLATASLHRRLVHAAGVDVTNLYAGFVSLAIRQLDVGGQLVAITPRSFANGPYFRAFRRDLLERVRLVAIHVYDTRDTAFADAAVLQENVIFRAERGARPTAVTITASADPGAPLTRRRDVPLEEVVRSDDAECFIRLSPDESGADAAATELRQPDSLATLGVSVSTGRVVDFRSSAHLRSMPTRGSVPLLYPTHMREGGVQWPIPGKKPNALVVNEETTKLLLPAGWYVLIKRFSSKEERRRIVSSVLTPDDLPGDWVAVENHVNVIHRGHAGLDRDLAMGLSMWLNSTVVDAAFRQFSGHTQVNATDLRSMRFPTESQLTALGRAASSPTSDQEKCDELVDQHILGQ